MLTIEMHNFTFFVLDCHFLDRECPLEYVKLFHWHRYVCFVCIQVQISLVYMPGFNASLSSSTSGGFSTVLLPARVFARLLIVADWIVMHTD